MGLSDKILIYNMLLGWYANCIAKGKKLFVMITDLKVFFRRLWKNKLYASITIVGFAVSLSFVILLGVYIKQELSVDQFHEHKDRIFRAVREDSGSFGTMIGGELKNKYPEIETFTRLAQQWGFIVNTQNEKVNMNFLMVDSSFFQMFSFHLLEGEPSEVLRTKNNVVLSRSYARKLFGNERAFGKEVNLNGEFRLLVTGIMEDMPDNTHFNSCDAILNFNFLADFWHYPNLLTNNGNSSFGLYFMTQAGTDLPSKAPQILQDFKENYWLYKNGYANDFKFEPLTQCYFGGKTGQGIQGNSMILVIMLSAIAIVILILALINYNNLSVAQASFRAKEVTMKKLLGTVNANLFKQFVLESVLLCLISLLLAVTLAFLLQPVFNQLLETNVDLRNHITFGMVVGSLIAIILLGIIAGLLPAFMITRFNLTDVVKGAFRKKTKGVYSKALICFQFAVAIALIISTLVIFKQTDYMRHYNLGFAKENVIWLESVISGAQRDALRSEFMKYPEVSHVSFVKGTPMDGGNNNSFVYQGKPVSFQIFKVDTAFFDLLNIQVENTGVALSHAGIWLNREALKVLELGDLPTEFKPDTTSIPVFGITDNFHFKNLKERIGPAILSPLGKEEAPWTVLVKIKGNNPLSVFNEVKRTYNNFVEGIPFDSGFMDEEINQWYEKDSRTAKLIGYFSALAIILSMMGILAMATYFIQQKVKEIGIRRVSGATVGEILIMLISDFMKWIVLAFVIACPIAWYAMDRWLSGFAYRIDMNVWYFIVAGGVAAWVALLIVGWQSMKAALTNPVNSLKSE